MKKVSQVNPTKVAKALRATKLSTRSIAAKTGVDQSTVVRLMHGSETGRTASMFTAVKIASGLRIARKNLLGN